MNRLKELRKEKKYTQIRMQMLTGIDQSNYSKMERGLMMPALDQLKQFALILNTSTDYLLELTDLKDPYPRSKK